MPKRPRHDPKVQALRTGGTLNSRPQKVADPLFREHVFFDARDLVQVKYEMVRRVEAEGHSATQAAAAFGLSRPTFYEARGSLSREGLAGLLPKKRGPRGGHKLRSEVVAFVQQTLVEEPTLGAASLSERVAQRFDIRVHPRSIERALARRREKGGP
jgi:transposase